MDETTPTLIFLIIILMALLFLKCCMDDCDAGKLTVCVGVSENINVPKCLERLTDFCDGEIGRGDHCYNFDEFGFDVEPTKEQLTEWLEQLRFVKDEIETNLDASEFFEKGGF